MKCSLRTKLLLYGYLVTPLNQVAVLDLVLKTIDTSRPPLKSQQW
jgi:hypothetical protein